MKKSFSVPQWTTIAVVSLISIILIFSAYYFIYVARQTDQLSEYYLRLLSVTTDNIEDSIDRVHLNIRNAVTRAGSDDTRQISEIRDLLNLIPVVSVEQFSDTHIKTRVNSGDTEFSPQLDLKQGQYVISFPIPVSSTDSSLQANTPLADLLKGTFPTSEFDAVMVVQQDGVILLNEKQGPVELIQLDMTSLWEGEKDGTSSDSKLNLSDNVSLGTGTMVRDVEIAGTDYKLFMQPIYVPLQLRRQTGDFEAESLQAASNGTPQQEIWILVGLQNSSRFRAQAMSIPSPVIFGALGLLLLTLLSLPFMKIQFLGIRERLDKNDVFVLVMTILVISSILTFTLIELITNSGLQREQDARLSAFSSEIHDALQRELAALDEQLYILTQSYLTDALPSKQANLFTSKRNLNPTQTQLLGRYESETAPLFDEYPFFEMLYWVDRNGMQQAKWTVRDQTTPLISLSTRSYFTRARDGELWTISPGMNQFGRMYASAHTPALRDSTGLLSGYIVESIRSKTTGEVAAVLAKRFRDTGVPDTSDPIVSAILSPLMSVIGPVIPSGFGYCIVENGGTVLFHANESRNLRENFFDEVDVPTKLRAAVLSRSPNFLNVNYRMQNYRLNSTPIPGTPWTLLTFKNKSPLNHMRIEILSFSLLLYCLYLLIALAVFFSLYALTARFTLKGNVSSLYWFWPNIRNHGKYGQMMMGCIVVIIGWGIINLSSNRIAIMFATVGMAMAALSFSLLILFTDSLQVQKWIKQVSSQHKYVLAGIIVMLFITGMFIPSGLSPPIAAVLAIFVIAGFIFYRLPKFESMHTPVDEQIVLPESHPPLRRALWFIYSLAGLFVLFLGICFSNSVFNSELIGITGLSLTFALIFIWVYGEKLSAVTKKHFIKTSNETIPTDTKLHKRKSRWYATATLLLLIVLGVLPPVSFYKTMHDETAEAFLKRQQVEFVEKLQRRADKQVVRFREVTLNEQNEDNINSRLYPETALDNAFDIHTAGNLITAWDRPETQRFTIVPAARVSEIVFGTLGNSLPGFEALSHEMRALYSGASIDSIRIWQRVKYDDNLSEFITSVFTKESNLKGHSGLLLSRSKYRPVQTFGRDAKISDQQYRDLYVLSALNYFPAGYWWQWILGGLVLVVSLWFLIRMAIFRIFLTDMLLPKNIKGEPLVVTKEIPHRMVLRADNPTAALNENHDEIYHLNTNRQALEQQSVEEIMKTVKKAGKRKILVTQFHDGLWESDISTKKLNLLEKLVLYADQEDEESIDNVEIEFHSEINPFHYFKMISGEYSEEGTINKPDLNRWAGVLEKFIRVRRDSDYSINEYIDELKNIKQAKTGSSEDVEMPAEHTLRLLAKECYSHPYLRKIGRILAAHPGTFTLNDPRHVINQILDLAEDYYQRLWALSGNDEKMILYRLCQEGLVSWRSRDLVRRLMHRGLILATPDFRPVNESFRYFVLRAEASETYRRWESQAEASVWSRFKWPVIVAIGIILVFFFTTQREVMQQTLAITAALAAATPALIKLFAVITQYRGKIGTQE